TARPTRSTTVEVTPAAVAGGPTCPTGHNVLWCEVLTRTRFPVLGVDTLYFSDGVRVTAVEPATRHVRWQSAALRDGPGQIVAATGGVVVVETSRTLGRAPGAVLDVVSAYQLLDAATGRLRFTVPVDGNRQEPAYAVAGGVFVGTEEAGAVTAYDLQTGRRRWHLAAPAGCRAPLPVPNSGALELSAAGTVLVEAGDCIRDGHPGMVGLLAGSGLRQWSRPLPGGLISAVGNPLTFPVAPVVLVRVPVGQARSAAEVRRTDPGALIWTGGGRLTDFAEDTEVWAVEAATGSTLWRERFVPTNVSASAANGVLCWFAVDTAAECRRAATGRAAPLPQGTSTRDTAGPGAWTDGTRLLHVIQQPDGSYSLRESDVATGRTDASLALPGPDLSSAAPPAVLGAQGSTVFVLASQAVLIAYRL
ncbi:MAG: PQQ-like beta-propeller repeat protein, partial [Actinomycetota bacterium]|nr:PQQ-like beta-propeller repeat protein [Actinomycetota bacterium]